ncbi:MAG TPA: NUDIX domain-containing protein [Verrucomicrobiae bacterium]|nr:NUDIX domain-containing protein [Verrucomicrobiae bacterium]
MNVTKQRIACKALIEHGGKILILREAPTYTEGTNIGRYHLPGGRIEMGEKFLVGLKREILEETGLTISVGKPLFVGEWFPTIHGETNQIVAIFFACKARTTQVKLSAEHDEYVWIKPTDVTAYDIMGPEEQVIASYLKETSV